jgi:hypothetical protein
VSFWGSDGAMEISFQVEFDALRKLNPASSDDEAGVLGTFDKYRAVIQRAANVAYSRQRGGYHRLIAANF